MIKNKKLLIFTVFIAIMALEINIRFINIVHSAEFSFSGKITTITPCYIYTAQAYGGRLSNPRSGWVMTIEQKNSTGNIFTGNNPNDIINHSITGTATKVPLVFKFTTHCYYPDSFGKIGEIIIDGFLSSALSTTPPPSSSTTSTSTALNYYPSPAYSYPTPATNYSYEYPSYFHPTSTPEVSMLPPSEIPAVGETELLELFRTATTTVTFPIKVTVNVRALKVRTEPNTSAPLGGSRYLYNNDKFITTSFAIGEKVEGENRWWISTKGNYVWVGGTKEKPY